MVKNNKTGAEYATIPRVIRHNDIQIKIRRVQYLFLYHFHSYYKLLLHVIFLFTTVIKEHCNKQIKILPNVELQTTETQDKRKHNEKLGKLSALLSRRKGNINNILGAVKKIILTAREKKKKRKNWEPSQLNCNSYHLQDHLSP